MAHFTGTAATFASLEKGLKEFEKECVKETHKIAFTLFQAMFAFTPVWSGETVRNYAAGVGRQPSGGTKTPLGTPPVGVDEVNRAANEAATLADLRAVLVNTTLKDIYVTNLVRPDKWELIESGTAPDAERARNKGGVSMRALQVTRAKHAGTVK